MAKQTSPSPSKRKLGCLPKTALILLGLVLILGATGRFYQYRAQQQDAAAFPPPGRLIETAHGTMHVHCMGETAADRPPILFESGLGGWSNDWTHIQTQLADTHRACAYDRLGYGWSDPIDADAYTAEQRAEELHALLQTEAAREYIGASPYRLVAASYGAHVARLYAHDHPDQVAGMVLSDPAYERDDELLPEAVQAQQDSLSATYSSFGTLANFGVVRLLDPAEMAPYAPFIAAELPSEAQAAVYYNELSSGPWWFTSMAEFVGMELSADTVEALPLPTYPLTILAATDSAPGGDEAIQTAVRERLRRLESLADDIPQATFQQVDSGHNIATDAPQALIDAIREQEE